MVQDQGFSWVQVGNEYELGVQQTDLLVFTYVYSLGADILV